MTVTSSPPWASHVGAGRCAPLPWEHPGCRSALSHPADPAGGTASVAFAFPKRAEAEPGAGKPGTQRTCSCSRRFCGRFELESENAEIVFISLSVSDGRILRRPVPRGEGSRAVPSLPTRGFPTLFYLLSNAADTLSQAVTHGSNVCAQALRLGALCRYRSCRSLAGANCVY